MSMDMPGGYLGQGGQKPMSMRPDWANDEYAKETRATYPARYAEAKASGEFDLVGTGEGFETNFGGKTQYWSPDTTVNDDGRSYTEIPHRRGGELGDQLTETMSMGLPRSQALYQGLAGQYVKDEMRKGGASNEQATAAATAMFDAYRSSRIDRRYERAARRAEETGEYTLGRPNVVLDYSGTSGRPATWFNDSRGVSRSEIPTPEVDAFHKLRPLAQGRLLTDLVDDEIGRQAYVAGMTSKETIGVLESVREARGKKKSGGGSTPASASAAGAAMSMDKKGGYLGQNAPLPRDWKPSKPTAKAAPLPRDWKPGDALPAGTVGMAPMTAAQEQAIRMAEERPTAGQIVGPVAMRLRDAQAQSDANWNASNAILDTGARLASENPDVAGRIRSQAAGAAMDYGLEAARQGRQWDQDYNRLIAVQTDPNGAMMFEQYQLGQIPGYQITSNPNVSPYWKKLVAEEPIGRDPARYGNIVREGSASRRGMSADYLESEADRQIGGVVDRMIRGGGNKAMRSAMQAYARAIRETTKYQPGTKEHEDALKAETEASGKVQRAMGGMLAKFEDRMGKEGGDVVKGSAWGMVDRAIRDRVQGALGQATQPGMAPQQPTQTRPQSPTRGTRGQQEPPTTPVVRKTLSNQTVEQFATPEVYFANVMSGRYTPPPGGAIQVGKEVYLPGLNYKPDGSTTPTLRPAIALGDYYVSDPRSFAGKNSAEQKAAWAAQLTDDERRDLFRAFVVEGSDSTLPAEIRKQLRAVYRSRLGINTSPLSEKDQSQALMDLKAREDDVLYAALVGFPGAREPRFQGEIEAPEDVPTSGGRGSSRPEVGGKPAPKFTKPVFFEGTNKVNPDAEPDEVKMPNFENVWKQLSEDQQMEFNTVLNMLREDMGTEFPAESLDVWERRMSEIRSSDIQSSDLIDKMFTPILQEVKVLRPDGTRIRSMREVRAWMNGDRSSVGPGLSQPAQAGPSQSVLTKPQQPPPPADDDRTTSAISEAQLYRMAIEAATARGPEVRAKFVKMFPSARAFAEATDAQRDQF